MKKCIIIIFLLSTSLAYAQRQAAPRGNCKSVPMLTEEDIERAHWDRRVSETDTLANFIIHLCSVKDSSEYYAILESVRIFDKKNGKLHQEINLLLEESRLMACQLEHYDYNFDGHGDFSIDMGYGIGPNKSALYFLYNSETGEFFDSGWGLPNLELLPSERRVTSQGQWMGGRYRVWQAYEVAGNELVLVEERNFVYHDQEGDHVEITDEVNPIFSPMRPGQIVLEGYEYTDKVIFQGICYDREYIYEEGSIKMYFEPRMGDKCLAAVEKDGNEIQMAYDPALWLYEIEDGDEMEITWSPLYYEAGEDNDTVGFYMPTLTDFPVLGRKVVFMAPEEWYSASEDSIVYYKTPGDDRVHSIILWGGDATEDDFHRGDTVSITMKAFPYMEPGEEYDDDADLDYFYKVIDITMVAPGPVTKFWRECKKEVGFERQEGVLMDYEKGYSYEDWLDLYYAYKEVYEFLATTDDPAIVKSLNDIDTQYYVYLSLFPKKDSESYEDVEVKAEIWDRDSEKNSDTLVATLAIKRNVGGSDFRFIDGSRRGMITIIQ